MWTALWVSASLLGLQSLWPGHEEIGALTEVRLTCKQVSSCEDAVILWCGGYRRADADHDGIPCENVCSSLDEVEAIRQQIGC